jgi:hypothetical protein
MLILLTGITMAEARLDGIEAINIAKANLLYDFLIITSTTTAR